ncbi:DNA glycosylase, partial [Desarmillaria ectypa]
ELVAHDPWKLIVAVTLLNKTSGKLAIPVFWELVNQWPTPLIVSAEYLAEASNEELAGLIHPLGTQTVRAKRLIEMSKSYLRDPPSPYDVRPQGSPAKRKKYPPTSISHLPGAGRYALDSYRIFCTAYEDPSSQEWKAVIPSDKKLVQYVVETSYLQTSYNVLKFLHRSGNGLLKGAKSGHVGSPLLPLRLT